MQQNGNNNNNRKKPIAQTPDEPIAIVGIGCRYPGGSNDPETFWTNLKEGKTGIAEVPADRWNADLYYDPDPDKPHVAYTKWGGFIDDFDKFDADFFKISPREAVAMDPQQRMLLEVSWEALEDAGVSADALPGSDTSVYVGVSINDYQTLQWIAREEDLHLGPGTALAVTSNRISHRYNLAGPSMSVDTACSSAMVATNLACHSLWRGESSISIVGGVNMMLHPGISITFSKANMMSKDSLLKAFDSRANGYIRGEGVGVVILKRLSDAVADGDRIYALIRGTVLNQDGQTTTITVPNGDAQMEMLQAVCDQAEVDPLSVSYVEAHGTGTPVGDPIEANAIGSVFGKGREGDDYLLMGSVKPNIGHLESGAGVAGLIKGALAAFHGEVPPNINFETPNENIKFDEYNLKVPTEVIEMTKPKGERYVAINSFGFGGTNACSLVSDYVPPTSSIGVARPVIQPTYKSGLKYLPLSAATSTALSTRATSLADWIEQNNLTSDDVALQLGKRNAHLDQRVLVTGKNQNELIANLRAIGADEMPEHLISGRRSEKQPLAMVFSGQGSQWWAMGRDLFKNDALFKSVLHRFDETFTQVSGWSLVKEMLAESEDASRINETIVTQPAICALQVGLVERWKAWGIEPDVVIGHSVGEIAAGYAAGSLTLEQAAEFIYHRARPQPEREGAIAAVGISLEEAEELCATTGEGLVEIGGINSPTLITIAGDRDKVHAILDELRSRDPAPLARLIKMNYAPHTFHVDVFKDEFLESVKHIETQAPRIKWISTVTGELITEAPDSDYFWRNIRQTVKFQHAIMKAKELDYGAFLEIGAHSTLGGPVHACLDGEGLVVNSLHRSKPDSEAITNALGQLYVNGFDLDWEGIIGRANSFVQLPHYPWEHKEYWPESENLSNTLFKNHEGPLLGERQKTQTPNWLSSIGLEGFRYIEGHNIDHSVIFPGAGYMELAFEAARALNTAEDEAIEIEDLKLDDALFMSEDAVYQVQTEYDPDRSQVIISSRKYNSDEEWTNRAVMKMRTRSVVEPNFPDWPEPEDDEDPTWQGAFYDDLHEANHFYGPTFQGVQCSANGETGSGVAWASIALPPSLEGKTDGYVFHPSLMDAVLQTFSGAVDTLDENSKEKITLPIGIRQIHIYREVPNRMRALNVVTRQTNDEIESDVYVTDEDKNPVAILRGFACKRLPRVGASQSDEVLAATYQEEWRALDVSLEDEADLTGKRLAVLVANEDQLVAAVRDAWHAAGGTSETLYGVAGHVDAQDPTSFSLKDSAAVKAVGERLLSEDFDTIISFLPLAGSGEARANLMDAQTFGTLAHLHLAQGLQSDDAKGPRMFVITRNAAPVGDANGEMSLAQTPVFGMVRTLANELKNVRPMAIDLEIGGRAQECAEQILNDVVADTPEVQVVYRGGRRLVNRIAEVKPTALPARKKPAYDTDRTVPFRVTMQNPGVIDSIKLVELAPPAPADRDVVVDVKAVGLNFRDIMAATNLLPEEAEEGDSWDNLGLEFAGIVRSVGSEVTNLKPGDRVMGQSKGTLRTQISLPAAICNRVPADVSFEEAASMPTAFMTALYCLKTVGRLAKGERILIHVATGGVGLAAIQIAKEIGAEIFATAGSDKKRQYLRDLGIEHVMNSRSLDFADQIMEITNGEGVDLVLNSLPKDYIEKGLDVLRPFGRFVEIGKVDIYQDNPIGMKALRKNISFTAVDLARIEEGGPHRIRDLLDLFESELASGRISGLQRTTFPVSDCSGAMRFMTQAKHIGKVVVTMDDPTAEVNLSTEGPMQFRKDGAYLITGGLSGFGMQVARWMAESQAGHIYLMGRSGADKPEAKAFVDELTAAGHSVHGVKGDVTSLSDVQRVVSEIQTSGATLRGVLHAATLYEDGFIEQQDEEKFTRVLGPKMLGAWNLHEATKDLPLEHFVMFSSIAAVVGSPGQSNYVAGNTFLDSFAAYRQANGLPALSINWGAMSGAGFVEDNAALASYLESIGMLGVEMEDAFAGLSHLLRQEPSNVILARIKWSALPKDFAGTDRYQELVDASKSGASTGGGKIKQELLALEEEERIERLVDYLAEQVAQVLKADVSAVEVDRPLNEFGLDSLTSFELKNKLEANLDAVIPANVLLQRPTLEGLAEAVSKVLEDDAGSGSDSGDDLGDVGDASAIISFHQKKLLAQIDRVSPDSDYRTSTLIRYAISVQPGLDVELLRQCMAEVMERHEDLRSYFPTVDGERTVAILEEPVDTVFEYDVTDLSEEAFQAKIDEDSNKVFDYETGPLMRLNIYHRPEKEDVLMMVFEQVVIDGWSLALVMNELFMLYQSKLFGTDSGVDPEPVPYRVFSNWQKKFPETDNGKAYEAYWERKLDDLGPAVRLPSDRPRVSVYPERIKYTDLVLPAELSARLADTAKEMQVTMYHITNAAFKVMLHKLSGAEDIVLNSAVTGRTLAEFEKIVGPTFAILPFRDRIEDPNMSFADFVKRVAVTVREGLINQHIDPERIAEFADVDLASDKVTPLNQFVFSMLRPERGESEGVADLGIEGGADKVEFGDYTIRSVRADMRRSAIDIYTYFVHLNGRTSFRMSYNSDVYSDETFAAFMQYYQDIMSIIASNPEVSLSELPVLQALSVTHAAE